MQDKVRAVGSEPPASRVRNRRANCTGPHSHARTPFCTRSTRMVCRNYAPCSAEERRGSTTRQHCRPLDSVPPSSSRQSFPSPWSVALAAFPAISRSLYVIGETGCTQLTSHWISRFIRMHAMSRSLSSPLLARLSLCSQPRQELTYITRIN